MTQRHDSSYDALYLSLIFNEFFFYKMRGILRKKLFTSWNRLCRYKSSGQKPVEFTDFEYEIIDEKLTEKVEKNEPIIDEQKDDLDLDETKFKEVLAVEKQNQNLKGSVKYISVIIQSENFR